MKYQLVKGYHDGEQIILWGRGEDGRKHQFRVSDFKPYFYIPDGNGKLVAIDGERVTRLVTGRPSDVPTLRDRYKKHYEADIKFVRRFLIDRGITSGFNDLLEPVDFSLPPRTFHLDIECWSAIRMPNPETDKILCLTLSNGQKYITLGLELEPDTNVFGFKTEEEMLREFAKLIERSDIDLLTGWNIDFDVEYLTRRCKLLGIKLNLDRMDTLDLLTGYRSLSSKAWSGRLKEVAKTEGLTDELEPEVNYGELWLKDRGELVRRNRRHVEWCVQLDFHYRITEFYWELKNLVGLEDLRDVFFTSVLVDTLLLRAYKGKWILPSKTYHQHTSYEGALVIQPPRGLLDGVAVYDMSRYYPSIIIAKNLTPEPATDKGIVPQVCESLFALREKYDKELKGLEPGSPEHKRLHSKIMAIKALTNSIYGYFAYAGSRLYNPRIAAEVTKTAREGLEFARQRVELKGHKVVYADTDSIYLQVPFDRATSLMDELNKELEGWLLGLKLKFERYFDKIAFAGKKRYAGRCVWEGKPTDYLYISGFEFVRRDASELTRRVQERVFDLVLRGELDQVIAYLKEVVELAKSGKVSLDDLALRKQLSKETNQYKSKMDYVRGVEWSKQHLGLNFKQGDSIKYIYCKKPTDVIAFYEANQLTNLNFELDLDKLLEKTVRNKVEPILELVGLSWEEVQECRQLRLL